MVRWYYEVVLILRLVACHGVDAAVYDWSSQKELKNSTGWRRWKRIPSSPQGWRGAWIERTAAALVAWQQSEDGLERCGKVASIHAESLETGCKICSSQERDMYRDLWCPRAECLTKFNARGFGHPQGMVYVGKSGRFMYLPIPKVASTTLRQWSVAAYKEESGRKTEADWLLDDSEKPIADRRVGTALWEDVPRAVRGKTAAFAVVRDPLERFASAWKELRAYERGPPDRRKWGRAVLRRQHFVLQAAAYSGKSNESIRQLFAAGGASRPQSNSPLMKELEFLLAGAVRDLACDPDWNEHLTPQRLFLPDSFIAFNPAIAPQTSLAGLLPSAARTAGLDHEVARQFATAGDKLHPSNNPKFNLHTNSREGWPEPEDLQSAFDRADATHLPAVPTRYLWCWLYAADYAAFPFFDTPPWCDEAFSSAGVTHPKTFQRRHHLPSATPGYRESWRRRISSSNDPQPDR